MKTEFWLFGKFETPLIDAGQVADLLRVKPKTVLNRVASGNFPRPREPGLWHIEDVARYCDLRGIDVSPNALADQFMERATAIVERAKDSALRTHGCYLYILFDGDEVVYVGKTNRLIDRLATHVRKGGKVFDSFAIIECEPEQQAMMELRLIGELRPRYNIQSVPA